jgi:hypothetical protein
MGGTMNSEQQFDRRRREHHPERIEVGGVVLIRNDIQAKQLGISERAVDRGDKHGAPFLFVGRIKYRPEQRYADFILSRIQTGKRRKRRTSKRKRGRS